MTDRYLDGYPEKLAPKMRPNPQSGLNEVGDLRIEGKIEPQAETSLMVITLREHTRHYRFEIPGPAAPEGTRAAIVVRDAEDVRHEFEGDLRLRTGKSTSFRAQNLDDQLRFEVDGELLIEVDVEPAYEQRSSITFDLEGAGGTFEDLAAYRDV